MDDFKHLDIEKVSARHIEEWIKIARLQGQWTATKSLQHQAELLGTEGPILEQFKVALKRIELRLPTPAKNVIATTEGIDLQPLDVPSQDKGHSEATP